MRATWLGSCLVLLVMLSAGGSAGAIDLVVDDDGAATVSPLDCDGVQPAFADLQGAVNSASSGDRVLVCPGGYGFVEVSTPEVTLESIGGPSDTSITGGASCPGANSTCAVLLSAQGATVRGFAISPGSGGGIGGAGIVLGADSSSIEANEFSGVAGLGGSASTTVGNVVEGNEFATSIGMNVVMDDSVIRDNVFHTVKNGLVILVDGDGNTIRSNKLRPCDDAPCVSLGIYVSGSDNEIRKNVVNGMKVALDVTGGAVIHKNNLINNEVGLRYTPTPVAVLSAENNWWGDPTGPSGGVVDPATGAVADGAGAKIEIVGEGVPNDLVTFDPWREKAVGGCGLGFEVALILPLLMHLASRRRHRAGTCA